MLRRIAGRSFGRLHRIVARRRPSRGPYPPAPRTTSAPAPAASPASARPALGHQDRRAGRIGLRGRDRSPAIDHRAGPITPRRLGRAASAAELVPWCCVASVVSGTSSTAICSGLPVHRGPAHPLAHGHQITRDHLRRIGPGSGRAGDGSPQGGRPARRRGVEQAHARLSGTCAAVPGARRRAQRRVTSISKSNALAATRIKRSRWISCGGRRRRRSTNWNATCAARIARRSVAIPTSAAIWWRCGRLKFLLVIHRQRGGRASDDV